MFSSYLTTGAHQVDFCRLHDSCRSERKVNRLIIKKFEFSGGRTTNWLASVHVRTRIRFTRWSNLHYKQASDIFRQCDSITWVSGSISASQRSTLVFARVCALSPIQCRPSGMRYMATADRCFSLEYNWTANDDLVSLLLVVWSGAIAAVLLGHWVSVGHLYLGRACGHPVIQPESFACQSLLL